MSKTWTKLYYHLVWSTSRRKPVIHANVEDRLYRYVGSRGPAYGYRIFAVNGTEDHMHVVASWGTTVSVSAALQKLKGSSVHFIRNELRSPAFKWQQGYGAFTFAERDLDKIVAYVKNQKAYHAKGSILDWLECDVRG